MKKAGRAFALSAFAPPPGGARGQMKVFSSTSTPAPVFEIGAW
jgi:hypothetical protein